jgi:RNA polymerase sigma factor (sigma-70 family)
MRKVLDEVLELRDPLRGFMKSLCYDQRLQRRIDDLAQETLLRALRYIDSYDPEIGSVKTWLFAIGANILRSTARSREYKCLSFEEVTEGNTDGTYDEEPGTLDQNEESIHCRQTSLALRTQVPTTLSDIETLETANQISKKIQNIGGPEGDFAFAELVYGIERAKIQKAFGVSKTTTHRTMHRAGDLLVPKIEDADLNQPIWPKKSPCAEKTSVIATSCSEGPEDRRAEYHKELTTSLVQYGFEPQVAAYLAQEMITRAVAEGMELSGHEPGVFNHLLTRCLREQSVSV